MSEHPVGVISTRLNFAACAMCVFAASVAVLVLSACTAPGPVKFERSNTIAVTYVYECQNGLSFTARTSGDTIWLFLPEQAIQLPRTASASTETYLGRNIIFRAENGVGILQTGDSAPAHCKNNPSKAVWEHARLNGVDFRAIGNEPAWTLEITLGGDMVFIGDEAAATHHFSTPEPQIDQSSRTATYTGHDGKHQLTVQLQGQPCIDSVSGESLEVTVTVYIDARQYRGCGTALH